MFVELLPILRNRSVMLTLALVGDKAIRVNVIPKRLKDSDSGDDALTTPLTVTGTPNELDREFAGQLVGFTEAFVKLGSNLAEIETAHTTAVKAVEAEKKKEIENKRKGSVSKASSTATEAKPGPVMEDGKPVFGTRTVTVETPSLFDSPGSGAISGESQNSRTAPTAEQPIGQSEAGATESADKPNGDVHGTRGRTKGVSVMGSWQRRQRFERSISPPIEIHSLIFIPARAELRAIPERPGAARGRAKSFAP
jgi:PRTRC genetic system protein E